MALRERIRNGVGQVAIPEALEVKDGKRGLNAVNVSKM